MMRIIVSIALVFAWLSYATAQSAYRLQAGDIVEIFVQQDPELRRQVKIAPDGRISLPQAGHIRAAGMTAQGLERALASRLQKNFTTPVEVTVIIASSIDEGEVDETRIFVTGEVGTPGEILVEEPTTVLQAIALAGGLGDFAAKKRIHVRRVRRDREVVIPFNYKDVERGRNLTSNIYLRSGDVVVVPERGLFE